MKIDSLDSVLTEQLRDVYDAEKQITKELPKMARAAQSQELKDALQEHLEITKGQISRLEEIFGMLDEKPKAHRCAGIAGILEEGQAILKAGKRDTDETLKDAAIAAAAQKVEHYEIAAYRSLYTFAEKLGNDRIAQLLEQTKEEEEESDRKLSSISEDLLSPQETGEEIEEEDEYGGFSAEDRTRRPAADTRSHRGR